MTLPLNHQIADYLTSLLPPGRPRRVARMSRPGERKRDGTARGKYEDIAGAFTHEMLQRHAAGDTTYSYMLDLEGKARVGAFDIDSGGREALTAALAAAHRLGIVAFAVMLPGELHDGGHVWALYDQCYPTRDIRTQMQQVVDQAGLKTSEIWPGYKQGIRGLFGYHQIKGTRGELLTQDGEVIDLDTDLASGFELVTSLRLNSAPPKGAEATPHAPDKGHYAKSSEPVRSPKKESSSSHTVLNLTIKQTERMDTRAIFAEARARFNEEHSWDDLLTGAGGTEIRPDYWACDCGTPHSHDIQIAVTSQDKIVGLSDRCGWVRRDRALDKFGFYCDRQHGGNYTAAATAIARQYGLWMEPERPRAAPERHDTCHRAPAHEAERKRTARRTTAATTRADVQARAALDSTLTNSDRAILAALLTIAKDKDWCRPSKEQIAEVSGVPLGTVKRAMFNADHGGRLEGRYFTSDGRGGAPKTTAIRTFLRGSITRDVIHESYITSTDSTLESLDLVSAAREPAAFEDWQWIEVDHSADELTALELFADVQIVQEVTDRILPQNFLLAGDPEIEIPQQDTVCAALLLDQADVPPALQDAAQVLNQSAASDLAGTPGYSVECVLVDHTRVVYRLWDDEPNVMLGEYDTESAALAAAECHTNVVFSSVVEISIPYQEAPAPTEQPVVCATPFDDSAEPEVATYMPVELAHASYSTWRGFYRPRDLERQQRKQGTLSGSDADWTPHSPPEGADDEPEQMQLEVASAPPKRAPDKPRAIDRYLVELAGMSERELGGEIIKHRRTMTKFKGAHWLSNPGGPVEKLKLVEQELDARDLADASIGTPPAAPAPSQAPARRPAQPAGMQVAFV